MLWFVLDVAVAVQKEAIFQLRWALVETKKWKTVAQESLKCNIPYLNNQRGKKKTYFDVKLAPTFPVKIFSRQLQNSPKITFNDWATAQRKLFDKDNRIKIYWLGTKTKQVIIAKVEAKIELQSLSTSPNCYNEHFFLWFRQSLSKNPPKVKVVNCFEYLLFYWLQIVS